MTPFSWLRKITGKKSHVGSPGRQSQRVASSRPRLEELEDRVTPTTFDTITLVSISITPNFVSQTANERVTATVINYQTLKPVPSGVLWFNLNGQFGPSVGLNDPSGRVTFSTSLPLYAVVSNQTLGVTFSGGTAGSDTFNPSKFLSPVYLNVLNAAAPSEISFGPLPVGSNPLFNAFNTNFGGETNTVSLFSIPIRFNYVDPGTISTFSLLGFNLPGSLSSALFGDLQSTIVSSLNQLI